MRVVLGLSGGVDSTVSALLLQEQGHEVLGCYLDNGLPGAEAAREAAEALKIPLTVLDIRAELEEHVCAPFAAAYLRGETPNPCVLCNPLVKFPSLLRLAEQQGAECIATGHYARAEGGRLFKGMAPNDQSYMLCRLRREQVERLLLPLGIYNKEQVRSLARQRGLAVADKAASMEICFIPDKDYARYIEQRGVTPPPGQFLYRGQAVGEHNGIHHYTLGQRRHLGIALGQRVYVSAIDSEKNTVTLSDDDEVWTEHISLCSLNMQAERDFPFRCTARIRHSRNDSPEATVYADGRVVFDAPVRAPTPGQVCALYEGEAVLGGGWIV
ncbi:MAG: tRNA 2-thiouridine(34) synthase MnmA [Clostridiales bacterium]|nr:tRNA 2-thiouridine(34) synthase MnmA [Candidatus Apopatocola equi]